MFDLNDFDETLPGPFDWDVKRLATSFTIAAQDRGFDTDLGRQLATLEWIDWFNHRRLFHELGRIPPAEYEANHYRQTESRHQVETQTVEPT